MVECVQIKSTITLGSAHRIQKMETHLIKYKSENTPTKRGCLFFALNVVFNGVKVKQRNGEYKTELGCCTCRLNNTEKNQAAERMRGSLQCVWAQYWYWAVALELK